MKFLRPCEGTCETRGWMSTIYTLLRGIDEWTRKPVFSRLRAHNYLYIRLNSDDQNIWILNMAENSENPNYGSDELSEISWKPEAQTLSDIGDDSLPCVCKLSSDGSRALPVGLSIYCQQPLYLYKRRQRKQVLGRTIYHDANGPYYEVGQTLILPDNFEG